jgi:hypothetical protein
LNEFFLDEITDAAESLIEEAIETNEPGIVAKEADIGIDEDVIRDRKSERTIK